MIGRPPFTKLTMSQRTLEVNLDPTLKKKTNKMLDVSPR
jgi:hypothetical protein